MYIKEIMINIDDDDDNNDDIISTTLKEEIPYLRYKISYDDNILLKTSDSFEIEIKISENGPFFIDIIAKIVSEQPEYLAYKRIYMIYKPKKTNLNMIILLIILGATGVILIFIFFLLFCICCYKKKNQELIKTVDKISFVIGDSTEKSSLDQTMTSQADDDDKESEEGPDLY